MHITLDNGNVSAKINLAEGLDISLHINKSRNVNCYYLDDPNFTYFESPQFVGSLAKGGSVNCEKISFYPHASGTHTECALHVLPVNFDMRSVKIPVLQLCKLMTVQPQQINGDSIINESVLSQLNNHEQFEALIVRTLPNASDKLTKNYSDSNPPYFEPSVMKHLQNLGFKHIITGLPSIDRESDEGRLAAHKNWFTVGDDVPNDRTITELIYIPDHIQDGIYALAIQTPGIETDAVPSRIVLYPCV